MLNIEKLAQELEFEEDEVRLLLDIFMENIDFSLQNLKEAIENNNFTAIYNEAHSIKGCAGNLMLHDIVDAVQTIEKYANEKQKTNCIDFFKKLEQEIKTIGYLQQCELIQ